jgi:hypothetical protein
MAPRTGSMRGSLGLVGPRKPGYIVLKQIGEDRWRVIGDVDRKPGTPAARARALAIEESAGGKVKPGDVYRAILRSEWTIAGE